MTIFFTKKKKNVIDDFEEEYTTSKSSRVWHVRLSPPKSRRQFMGKQIPSVEVLGLYGLFLKKPSMISLQICGNGDDDVMPGLLTENKSGHRSKNEILQEGEKVLFLWNRREGDDGKEGFDKCELDAVEVLHSSGEMVEILFSRRKIIQQICFASKLHARTFLNILQHLRELEMERADRDLKKNTTVGSITGINLLVEIVSALRLPSAGNTYVKVHQGREEVHQTDVIKNSTSPIWTVQTKSFFLLNTTPEEFFKNSSGLVFTLTYSNKIVVDVNLGKVRLSQKVLLLGDGSRNEYSLEGGDSVKSKLVLKFQPASPEDINFMTKLSSNGVKQHGVYAADVFEQPKSHSMNYFKTKSRKKESGEEEYRVKPSPDPDNKATKWMTKEQMDTEIFKESKTWIEAGSGELGKLYLEVLGCDGLPNKDAIDVELFSIHNPLKGVTDSFACIIYEDTIVNTDVLMDTCSPRWLPWTRRAFMFNIANPSSQVYISLFDFNDSTSHDFIGRITVDITNIDPKTDHVLKYVLFPSNYVSKHRIKEGIVTVRIRVEWGSERETLLRSLFPIPVTSINVSNSKDFRVAYDTIIGKYDVHSYNRDILVDYVEELQEYEILLPLMLDAIQKVLFWHCDFQWNMTRSVSVSLPLNSVVAFLGGITLAENYNLFPSFVLFSLAWFFLAMLVHQQQHPNPWERKRGYLTYWRMLLFNSSAPLTVEAYENKGEIVKYDSLRNAKMKKRKERREREKKEAARVEEEKARLTPPQSEAKLGNFLPGLSTFNPLSDLLLQLQLRVRKLCVALRITNSIILWRDGYLTFWLTNSCILTGILLLFVPWDKLIKWTFRILVWTLLGPWMKLVDTFYMQKLRIKEDEDIDVRLQKRYHKFMESSGIVLRCQEEDQKRKAMRSYMFGKYRVEVPRFKEDRYIDVPLPASYAHPHASTSNHPRNVSDRILGQHLVMNEKMLPHFGIMDDGISEASVSMEGSVSEKKKQ